MYFLGVDGGGTKTTFTLIDEDGKVKISITKGTCHFSQIGFANLELLLKEGLNEILEGAHVKKDQVRFSFLGLAGYGKVKEARPFIEKAVSNAFVKLNYTLDSDIRVAIAGALSGRDGINIIAGTGSIGLALRNNTITLCGGWGATVGDEGSAYWIGKKSIQAFSKQADGRSVKGKLYNLFLEELSLEDEYKIISYLNDRVKNDRGEIAKLSQICYKAALEDDIDAISIFKEAAKELAEIVKVLFNQFKYKDEILVSYTGGVFKAGELIMKPLKLELAGYNIKLIEPVVEPHLGACILAYINSGNEVSDEFISNLKGFQYKVKL